MPEISPILKWAGGKRQLLPELLPLIPTDYEKYFEPFLGAGAVLFSLCPSTAIVNDTNTELINVYSVVKTNPHELVELLREHDSRHSKDYYYEIRNADRDVSAFARTSNLYKAARTIYLNRTCYNGLYRVNKSGFFNTPIGKNSVITIVQERFIYEMSDYLNRSDITFLNGDYLDALNGISEQDFVFLDPPYYPMKSGSFVRYDSDYFDTRSQEDLRKVCDSLTRQGIRFIQTNSNCEEIRDLYSNYKQIEVKAKRYINSKADGRLATELIISNY